VGSVGVRTAAGGTLSLTVTPADVIGRCDHCRRTYREGDWYCDHLAARHGHRIAWMADQTSTTPAAVEPPSPQLETAPPAAFAVSFRQSA
jgi:hypothetical protein